MNKHIFYFEPDYDQLFYDPEEGYSYYDTIYLSETEEIKLNISPALNDWLNKYIEKVLFPCAAGQISLDKLNKTFDWKTFHEQGIKFAKEIKKQLPENIILKYTAPFEDKSGIITKEINI